MQTQKYYWAGTFATVLRLVVGWTYFSAFWRRLILENKLDPEQAGYIGEKFNHFLPHALGIKPIIEYLVSNPESLWWAMAVFTIVEGVVGLFMMLGLFTRFSAVATFGLAMGILLGSGWIGTTCLDEWQIGILGVAAGFLIFMSGSGTFSLDHYFAKNELSFTKTKWFYLMGSGSLPFSDGMLKRISLIGALSIFGLTLFTNQHFHGGVWGKLHNKSVRPQLELSNVKQQGNSIFVDVMRVEGADVYGSFVIAIELLDTNENIVKTWNQTELSELKDLKINNHYVAKIKPGKHSLIFPLGAKAMIELQNVPINIDAIRFVDISGVSWTKKINE